MANPDIFKINYLETLEEEAVGMAFPINSKFFDQYSPLYGQMDLASIQNPKPVVLKSFRIM